MPAGLALAVPVLLLAGSNVLMNLAWYGHLKGPPRALWLAVLLSWGFAFFEYCLAVPANRIGARIYTLGELKAIQEVLSLTAFVLIAWLLFNQRPGINEAVGFTLIAAGAYVIFKGPFR
jgi:uncharacterized protein (DUF486 family)